MIRKALNDDTEALTSLALQLWPEHNDAEMAREFADALRNPDCALFLAFDGETPIGFAQCQLRHDYVEGTESSPVGYLEGIFVARPFRRQGIARRLLAACEEWARQQGCREFASDCELSNRDSLAFHLSVGFAEANRIICFTRTL